jgi:hypothetical protein
MISKEMTDRDMLRSCLEAMRHSHYKTSGRTDWLMMIDRLEKHIASPVETPRDAPMSFNALVEWHQAALQRLQDAERLLGDALSICSDGNAGGLAREIATWLKPDSRQKTPARPPYDPIESCVGPADSADSGDTRSRDAGT